MPIVEIKGVGKAEFPDDMPIEDIRTFLQSKFSNPEPVLLDARFGELGKIENPDGSISTEFSITEFIPELGGFVNIPTLVRGQKDVRSMLDTGDITDEQFNIAVLRAIERVSKGAALPSFKTVEEAVEAAKSRPEAEKMRPFISNSNSTSLSDNQNL